MEKRTLKDKFKNWAVKKKLVTGFSIAIAAMILLGILSSILLLESKSKLTNMYEGSTMSIHYSAALYYPQLDIQRAVNTCLAEGVDNLATQYPKMEEDINESLSIMLDAYDKLKNNLHEDSNKELLQEIYDKLSNEVGVYRTKLMELIKSGNFDEALDYNHEYYRPSVEDAKKKIDELQTNIFNVAAAEEQEAITTTYILLVVQIAVIIAIVLACMKISTWIVNAITEPIAQIKTAAEQLRVGDLSQGDAITYESEDELGVLAKTMRESINILDGYVIEIADNFNRVADKDLTVDFAEITDYLGDFASIKQSFVRIIKGFNNTLSKIKDNSKQVDRGSEEVAAAAGDLASGTSEQASAAEELTATVETISSMSDGIAQEAEKTYKDILVSISEAQEARAQMQELEKEMENIKSISGEIEDIVTSIKEIASQTSLLALNASIEAARAGEAGSGFAVVADQIGKLATDSANAVVNTKELISATIEEINKGNATTKKTALSFEKVVKDMEAFAEASSKNSEVSRQQSQALQEIEHGIDQITNVTQQNAAASQECSAISAELADRATEMDALVNQFKLFG